MFLTDLVMLISNLVSDLPQEERFLSYSSIFIFYGYESKIGQPDLEIPELSRIIVLISHCIDESAL